MKAPTERDPARRYKLYWVGPAWFESHAEPMGLGPEEMAEARALIKAYPRNGHYVAFSPDGIRFTPHLEKPALAASDFSTTLFDERAGRYRSYHKIEHREPDWSERRRCMWLAESDDGLNFGESRLVLAPDATDDELARALGRRRAEFYGMHVWPCGDHYLGLLWVFTVTNVNPKFGMGWDDGRIEPQLTYSPDGIAWQRRPVREPFIPCGPAGTFDAGMVCSAGDHPVVIADEVRFYYVGVSYTRGYTEPVQSPNRYSSIGLATLSVDRCGSPAASCT